MVRSNANFIFAVLIYTVNYPDLFTVGSKCNYCQYISLFERPKEIGKQFSLQ